MDKQDERKRSSYRKMTWLNLFVVYTLQGPVLIGYIQGWCPVHPIVVMLPLIGWLNFKVEKRGLEGLGITPVRAAQVGLLAFLQGGSIFLGYTVVFSSSGFPFTAFELTTGDVIPLFRDVMIAVFIIALWEELVNRGFLQTRLQSLLGFGGVIGSAMLFTIVHIPSAWQDFSGEVVHFSTRLSQVALVGFLLCFVYWRSGSVLASMALHAASNVALVALVHVSGLPYQAIVTCNPLLHLLWTLGQVIFMVLITTRIFPGKMWVSGHLGRMPDSLEVHS